MACKGVVLERFHFGQGNVRIRGFRPLKVAGKQEGGACREQGYNRHRNQELGKREGLRMAETEAIHPRDSVRELPGGPEISPMPQFFFTFLTVECLSDVLLAAGFSQNPGP